MAWLSASDVLELVASNQHKKSSDLEDFWPALVERATTTARGDLKGPLLSQGYTPAQIDAWDDGADWHGSQAVWQALTYFLATQPYELGVRPALADLDRRDMLDTAVVTNGGVVQVPGDASQGPVGHGRMSVTGDLFVSDPLRQDCRRVGQRRRWGPMW